MLLPGQSLQFSVLKASQKKNLGCKLVNVSPWLLAQLSLQRLHQQNNSPSRLPQHNEILALCLLRIIAKAECSWQGQTASVTHSLIVLTD